jgi:hypothetical protein
MSPVLGRACQLELRYKLHKTIGEVVYTARRIVITDINIGFKKYLSFFEYEPGCVLGICSASNNRPIKIKIPEKSERDELLKSSLNV